MSPLSATTNLQVAVRYSRSQMCSLLLKLRTTSFIDRGASIAYLSAFPAEEEILCASPTENQILRLWASKGAAGSALMFAAHHRA
eukprot:6084724-Prymnesium_polylepis.2